ncbi:MAG: ester cyclase [Actinomycetota bacterium]
MSEGHRTLARRAVEEIYAPDYVLHEPSLSEDLRGPEGVERYARMYRDAFPDMHITVEDEIAERDKLVMRWIARGTHTGDLTDISPTGNRAEMPGITISRMSGGKIAEEWTQGDDLGLMQQPGVVLAPERVGG